MSFIRKIFEYFEPAWTGNDGKFSLRSFLAILFSVDFIRNLSHAVYKWDTGKSMEGLALALSIEAGLIAGLLVLKTYQNITIPNKSESQSPVEQPEESVN
jgi:hypothetical protein